MRPSFRTSLVSLLLIGAALPAVASEKWSLSKAIPADAFWCIQTSRNPQDQFLCDYWGEVWEAFRSVGIENDLKAIIESRLGEAERADFQALYAKCVDLCGSVEWGKLFGDEFVFAEVMQFPTPSYLFIFRTDKKTADKSAAGLRAILEQIADLEETLKVEESRMHGAVVWRIQRGDEMSLALAQRGDILVAAIETSAVQISFNSGEGKSTAPPRKGIQLLERTLKLLDGDKTVKRLIDQPAYKRAMAALPEPESEITFFDANTLLSALAEGMSWVEGQVAKGDDAAQAAPWFRAVQKGIGHFKLIDCIAGVVSTEGFSRHTHTVTMMAEGAKDKPLYKVFGDSPEIEKFDKFLPKQATGFSVTSGIDLQALYSVIMNFIRDELPGGQEILETWTNKQLELGFDVEKDLLSWLGREVVSVSMPPAVPSPFGGSDWVLLTEVRDEAKANEAINGLKSWVAQMAEATGQPIVMTPAKDEALAGFQSVTHPAIMMFFRPCFGVKDGRLIVGSGERAIDRCLATARGENPSIRENERFAKEGLIPNGPVCSVSFKDKSKMGQELAQLCGVLGMAGGFIPAQDEGAKVVRSVLQILQKLTPVAAKINFFNSEAAVCVRDGNMFRTHTVTHYKKPQPPEELATDTTTGEKIPTEK